MTSIASTHVGTCQLCGKEHMLPGGKLAKHGYTVRHGFFSGVCGGSDHAPFEKSKELAEASIASAEARRDRFIAAANAVPSTRHDDGTIWFSVERKGTGRNRYEGTRDWEQVTLDFAARTITAKDGTVNKFYSYDSEDEFIAGRQDRYRQYLLAIADEGRLYIEWQKERCASWVEKELKPAPEKDEGKTHIIRYVDGSGYVRSTYGKGWGGVFADKTEDKGKAARYTEKGAKMTMGKLRMWGKLEMEAL